MKALDVKEGIQIFKKKDQKAYQTMNSNRRKFLNNIALTKVTDFFDENIKYSREEIMEMIQTILKNRQVTFENRECVESALESYSHSKESFSECLNDSVNRAYDSFEKKNSKQGFFKTLTNLIIQRHPVEERIRLKAPSNLPIYF